MIYLFTAALPFRVAAAHVVPQVPGSAPSVPVPTLLKPPGNRGDTVLARLLGGETGILQNPWRSYADDAALQAASSLTGSELGGP